MPYYLRHYFMPDFNHKRLRPVVMADGNVNAHFLGYVQSVVAGQVLAELIPLETLPEGCTPQDGPSGLLSCALPAPEEVARAVGASVPLPVAGGYPSPETVSGRMDVEENNYKNFHKSMFTPDPRFVYNQPVFPMGPNCGRDPGNPMRIVALTNGYCFYHQGLITVKKLLNVRQDVNFRTGNIFFAGDIVAHGDVCPGFTLTGSNILVKGRVDGGTLKAGGAVAVKGGIKAAPKAMIRAGGTVRLAYCERATVITPGNLIIDGNCVHSDLYVGGSVIIKGRLLGGNAHANGLIYAADRIGDEKGAVTRLSLGYNPLEYLELQELQTQREEQERLLRYHTSHARKGPHFAAEVAKFQEVAAQKLDVIREFSLTAWKRFTEDMRKASRNRVVAPGDVFPGVEISIGRAYLKVVDKQFDVFFCLNEDEVVYGHPALSKNHALARERKGTTAFKGTVRSIGGAGGLGSGPEEKKSAEGMNETGGSARTDGPGETGGPGGTGGPASTGGPGGTGGSKTAQPGAGTGKTPAPDGVL